MRIDHVAIAVQDLDEAVELYRGLLGCEPHIEDVPTEGVKVAIFKLHDSSVELVSPTSPDSPISKFLDRRGPGLHHIALRVADVDKEVNRLDKRDVKTIGGVRKGSRGTSVCFLHPKTTCGTLIELVEKE